jgi:hypothetical protein
VSQVLSFRFQSSVLRLLFSVILLLGVAVIAQDDPFITVSDPAQNGKSPGTAAVAGAQDVFITVSAPEAKKAEAPVVSVKSASTSVASGAAEPTPQPVSEHKNNEIWGRELLRDPFWPVGFFPPNWQAKTDIRSGADSGSSGGWKAAFSKLKVSGTSRLGDRTAAIINGKLTGTGEKVEVLHEGKVYQWEIVEITADGQIQLKKLGTR